MSLFILTDMILYLLQNGVTPLIAAAAQGNSLIVNILLSFATKADLTAIDKNNNSNETSLPADALAIMCDQTDEVGNNTVVNSADLDII